MLSFRSGISVAELVVYFPSLLVAVWIASRHGFGRNAGWFFIIIFSLVRIIGAICQLISISHPSTGVLEAAFICSSVGLSPLLLVLTGLLSRVNDNVSGSVNGFLNPVIFKGIFIISLAGLILSIIGGTNIKIDTIPIHIPVESKVGIIIFVVLWIVLLFILLALATKISRIMLGEKRLLLAVALSTPLLLIRLIYAVIAIFSTDQKFSLFDGSAHLYLGLAVIEEFLIIIICLSVGATLQKISKSTPAATASGSDPHYATSAQPLKESIEMDATSQPTQHGYSQNPPPAQAPRRSRRRGGPIHQLVGMGMDHYKANRRGDVEAQ